MNLKAKRTQLWLETYATTFVELVDEQLLSRAELLEWLETKGHIPTSEKLPWTAANVERMIRLSRKYLSQVEAADGLTK